MSLGWHEQVEALYLELYAKMLSVAQRLTGDDVATAEDLIQNAFLTFLFNEEKFADHPNPEACLMKILRNHILNERRLKRNTEISLDEELHFREEIGVSLGVEEVLPQTLSENDRELLRLRYGKDMSTRQIANLKGIAEAACRSRLSRAVKRCRKLLGLSNDVEKS